MTYLMPKQYTTPKVNLNGTSAETLREEWQRARTSVCQAIHDLNAATCHPRDFQFQEEGAWVHAKSELDTVLAYMDDAYELTTQWLTSIEEQRN